MIEKRLFLSVAFCIVAFSNAVWAHTSVKKQEPAEGDTVAVAPENIRIEFVDAIEAGVSSFTLTNNKVEKTIAAANVCDANICLIPFKGIEAGPVFLVYRVIALDGHVIKGKLSFTFAPN